MNLTMNKRKTKKMKKSLINKKAFRYYLTHSNIMRHAVKELDLAGYKGAKNNPNQWMREQVLETLAVFASHGNSGFSAPFEINLFKKLASWDVIKGLNFTDDEWDKTYSDSIQNKRNSAFFKLPNGRIEYIYGFSVQPARKKELDKDFVDIDAKHSVAWNSGFWVTKDGVMTGIYIISNVLIRPEHVSKGNYHPVDKIYVHCDEIEIAKDNWIFAIDNYHPDVELLKKHYNLMTKFAANLEGKRPEEVTPEDENIALKGFKNQESVII